MRQTESTFANSVSITDNEQLFWISAILFYGFGDIVTTLVGLRLPGITEGGPFVTVIVDQHGPGFIYVVKVTTITLFYFLWRVTPRSYRVGVPIGVSIVGISTTIWNSALIIASL